MADEDLTIDLKMGVDDADADEGPCSIAGRLLTFPEIDDVTRGLGVLG